ncbi:hypothetical protein T439DRAFT_326704 [Meredithblackwellia eburnea MCA 4105]
MFKKRRPTGVKSSNHNQDSESPLPIQDEEDDGTTSEQLEELIALRKLKRSTGGIDINKLNQGEQKKKKRPRRDDAGDGTVTRDDGMIEGTKGGISNQKDRLRDDDDDPDDVNAKARRIVKSNNFTGQTNAVDVDKHMMAYIESELQKRKGGDSSSALDISKELASLDPRDALYEVAEKYKNMETRNKRDVEDEDKGGLSAAMLTAIPEVDLGIDSKLKNIEATERAKRLLQESKTRTLTTEEEEFAAQRFYKSRKPVESDAEALAKARMDAAGGFADVPAKKPQGQGRREMATDDQVMDRFKKRQAQQGRR